MDDETDDACDLDIGNSEGAPEASSRSEDCRNGERSSGTNADIEYKELDEYDYQIVVEHAVNCSCGALHEAGDTLWGGQVHPDELHDDMDWTEKVGRIHDGDLAVKTPSDG